MPSLPFRVDMAMVLAPTRTRRIIVLAAIFVFFLFYFRSLSFKSQPAPIPVVTHLPNYPPCLNGYRAELERQVGNLDSIVTIGSHKPEKLYMVANGYVATTPLTGSHSVLLEGAPPLDLGHNINLKFYLRDTSVDLAMSVLHMTKGQVDLYYVGEGCLTVKETIFASLENPSLIVHHVTIHNPSQQKQTITVKAGIDTHLDHDIQKIKVGESTGYVYSDLVHGSKGESYVAAAASLLTHKIIQIEGGKYGEVQMFVSLAASQLPDVGERSEKLKQVSSQVRSDLNSVDQAAVLKSHHIHWAEIRKSGLRIQPLQDHLMAKPMSVNLTMYYLVSMFRPPSTAMPAKASGCFKGSPTSHSPVLWTPIKSLDSAYTFLANWSNEMNKGGCGDFIAATRILFHQALLRSFAGVLETIHGLELALNPHSLEGYIDLWGIEYEEVLINISVAVNTPSHTGYVKVSKDASFKDTALYACDQICSSEITSIPQNGHSVTFAIKPTNPSTPILYIASQSNQLIELRHLIEQHHGLELHSLEEHPISALFIIIIAVVIVVFHALLFHMIYKEFCSGDRGYNKSSR